MINEHEFNTVAELLNEYSSCLIATHVNPEGDAIGSQLALALALEALGMQVYCYDRDGVPENCRFLPTWNRVATVLPKEMPPLVIYVDAESLQRCNLSPEQFPSTTRLICIDHHKSYYDKPIPSLIDSNAAATGEIVFPLIKALKIPFTAAIATCLQTALMVDTGRFCYTNTRPNTLNTAAELIAAGADVQLISEWIWGRISLSASLLQGAALNSINTANEGRIAWAVLRARDFTACGATAEDTEGIIDCIRNIDGVQVAILFSEKAGEIRASLRSRGEIDVSLIAKQFNGGGHAKAAGLNFNGPMEYAVAEVIKAIETRMQTADN